MKSAHTLYSGKTAGFCCWVSFSVLGKDCGAWFGISGGCFRWLLSSLAQDLPCMKQEGSSGLVCHVPSLSFPCIHHGEGLQNLLAPGARLFHLNFQAAAHLPVGAEQIWKPHYCRWAITHLRWLWVCSFPFLLPSCFFALFSALSLVLLGSFYCFCSKK